MTHRRSKCLPSAPSAMYDKQSIIIVVNTVVRQRKHPADVVENGKSVTGAQEEGHNDALSAFQHFLAAALRPMA